MPTTRQTAITLRFLAEPSDVNFGGNVHGGAVMKWIDHAGYSCAATWSASYCVTAYVGGIRFLQPINVGDLVELMAEIMRTGRSSMHISVSVYARNPRDGKRRFTTHCILVFVAVDNDGKAKPVPEFAPANDHERYLKEYATHMIDLRQKLDDQSEAFFREFDRNDDA